MTKYECDCCGACCKGYLIVEADELDLIREPRLIESDPDDTAKSYDQVLADLQQGIGKVLVIACGTDFPCKFLGADDRCTIYPTRPNDCVAMQAGDEQCQVARVAAGLSRLQPVVE